jgi:hypothetical protein
MGNPARWGQTYVGRRKRAPARQAPDGAVTDALRTIDDALRANPQELFLWLHRARFVRGDCGRAAGARGSWRRAVPRLSRPSFGQGRPLRGSRLRPLRYLAVCGELLDFRHKSAIRHTQVVLAQYSHHMLKVTPASLASVIRENVRQDASRLIIDNRQCCCRPDASSRGVAIQNLNPNVLMMDPAEDRYRYDAAELLGSPKIWNPYPMRDEFGPRCNTKHKPSGHRAYAPRRTR